MSSRYQLQNLVPFLIVAFAILASPVDAFGAGYVARGSARKGLNFRHGDIANAIYILATADSRVVRTIYFGNWMRDFSQLLDKRSVELVPEPILRALVAVLAFVQFGYSTREFEVTADRLGKYRPEEHVDNPKGYDTGSIPGLREPVNSTELEIDLETGMKNYIASPKSAEFNKTSYDYVEEQLVAAIACARGRDSEAYIHLGAAMHTLEDFVAHSNWVELCMQMIGRGAEGGSNVTPALSNIFPFVGDATTVQTKRGLASPLVTGTFGALDLYQTLLGEIDDKVTAMSLPGLEWRLPESGGSLKGVAQSLIGALNGADSKSFDSDITKVIKAATNAKPADWNELKDAPDRLWQQLEPIFRLRDDIVKWVWDNLTIKPIQDAIAAISTALDKLVYWVIGIFLKPVLADISKALQEQEEALLIEDQQARLAKGELSVFDGMSAATDPTHSQLCKDHYDHDLNEIAGRVAVKISGYAISKVTEVWQPGTSTDVRPVLADILSAFHHPYNFSPSSEIQTLMFTEVLEWCNLQSATNPDDFEALVQRLDKPHMAAKFKEDAAHIHAPTTEIGQAHDLEPPTGKAPTPAHTLTTVQPKNVQGLLSTQIGDNLASGAEEGLIPGLSMKDIPGLRNLLSAAPGADNPNPIDHGLMGAGGGVGLLQAFKNIEVHDIVAAPGMGNILKEGVVRMLLRDPARAEIEMKQARQRLGIRDEMAETADALARLDIHPMDDVPDQGLEKKTSKSPVGIVRRTVETIKSKS